MIRVTATFVAISLLYPLFAFFSGGEFAVGGFLAVASFTIPAALILGFPAFLFFRKHGWLSWRHLTVGGATIGLVCALPFVVGGASMFAQVCLSFTAIGVAHGLLFWLLGIWRNQCLTSRSRGTP